MKKYRYPGARPFTEDQKAIFFGRDREKKELLQLIDLDQVILLHSKSGMGKSSLINAGIIPELTKNGSDDPAESTAYVPILFRFGAFTEDSQDTPLKVTRRRIRMEHPLENSFLEKILPGDDSLWTYLKNVQIRRPKAKGFIMIFDQFEELFTYPKEQIDLLGKELASAFFEEIPQRFIDKFEERYQENDSFLSDEEIALLHEPFRLKIIFAIRSDRMSLMDKMKRFFPTILQNTYELEALSAESAEEAIINPAYSQEPGFISPTFDYSDEALEYILSYLTKNKTQKIESFQLQILCQYVETEVIDKNLKEVTVESLGDLDEIYANYYGNQIAKLDDEQEQLAARKFIEEGLILEEEQRRLSLHESQILSFYGISIELLRKLVDTHLIRREPTTEGGYIYELSHDSIVAPILIAKKERREKEVVLAEQRRKEEEAKRLKQLEEERKIDKKRLRTLQRANITTIAAILLTVFAVFVFYESKKQREKDALEQAEKDVILEAERKFSKSNSLTSQAMIAERLDRTKALKLIKEAREINSENTLADRVLNELLISSKSYPFYQHEFKGHRDHIHSVDISGNGQWILSGGKDKRVSLWTIQGDSLLDSKEVHTKKINAVQFSNDRKYAVSASDDSTAIIWKVTKEGALQPIDSLMHEKAVLDAAFSPEGNRLITCQAEVSTSVLVWRKNKRNDWIVTDSVKTLKGRLTAGLLTKGPRPEAVYATQDGLIVAFSVEKDTSRSVLDLSEKKIFANAIALSKKGDLLAAGLSNGMIKLLDFSSGDELLTFFAHDSEITDISFGADGTSILSCSSDKKAKQWDLEGRLLTTYLGNKDGVNGIATDQEGKYIVTGGEDRVIKVWEKKEYFEREIKVSSENVWPVEFSEDGIYMAAGSDEVKIYEVASPDKKPIIFSPGNKVNALRFLSKKKLAVASGDMIRIYDVSTKELIMKLDDPESGGIWSHSINCLAQHPVNSTLLAAGNQNGDIVVWDHTTGEIIKEKQKRKAHADRIFDLAFSSSGDYLITGSRDKTARIWEFGKLNEEPLRVLDEHKDFVRAVAASPVTDTLFLTGSYDNTIQLWYLNGEQPAYTYESHTSDISSLDFAKNGKEFISASSDNTARIWTVNGGEKPSIIQHNQSIRSAVYSFETDPVYILTGCKDGTIRLWKTGRAETLLKELDEMK
jgi:WD40 repeat protein